MKSSRSVRLVEKANELTAPSELLGIYRKFGDYPVSRHGAQALWGRETMAGMADGGPAAGGRLEAELGYGMPVGGRLVGMPSFGIGASGHGRDYRLGYGLTVAEGGATHFDLGVYANRRVWARELRSTALEAGSPRAGNRYGLPGRDPSGRRCSEGPPVNCFPCRWRAAAASLTLRGDKSTRGAILREQP